MRIRRLLSAAIALLAVPVTALALTPAPASAAALQEITDFGPNPSALRMYLYVPSTVKPDPALVVAVHYCHGDGVAFYNGSDYWRLAEQYGFIVVYPSVTQAPDGCFDGSSSASLTHGGGGDSLGIVSMVDWAKAHYGVDASRVYATGVSSGAMMTNVLLGAYPDVFAAGSAFAGVPFGCGAEPGLYQGWNALCAQGQKVYSAQEWGDLVRAAYPGYTGPRPRFQLWHGTSDEVLSYVNFGEEIKQWTNVFGISQTPTSTDHPAANQTRTRYADAAGRVRLEAYSLAGTSHNLPVDAAAAIRFFGLDGATTSTTTSPPTTTTTTSRPTTTTTTTTTTTSRPTTTTTTTTRPTTTTTTTSRPSTITTTTTRPTTTTTTPTTTTTTTTTTTSRPTTTTTTTTTRPTTTTTTPTTTTTTTPQPVTTTDGWGARTCSATYAVAGQWPGGFQGDVRVTAGDAPISSWQVSWTFPSGQTISQSWGTALTTIGSHVTAFNAAWNGSLAVGQSVNFGFLATWDDVNGLPTLSCSAS